MKNLLTLGLSIILWGGISAQTDGTLTFSFTPTSHSGYDGTKNVLAVWIRDVSGGFVKTKIRNVGFNTADHLPTWAVNSGGASWNALTGCNTTDAVTGATLHTFTPKTIIWDGKNVNGNQNGTTVPDGTYKVFVESTWDHGASNHIVRAFTFTKGPNADNQTPSSDPNLTNISLTWTPGVTGINEKDFPALDVYPNPTTDKITVNYSNANEIKIINQMGSLVYTRQIQKNSLGSTVVDMTKYAKGVYYVLIINEKGKRAQKIILE